MDILDWFEGLNVARQVAKPVYDVSVNRYKVSCGGDLDMWESSGWITGQPLGNTRHYALPFSII